MELKDIMNLKNFVVAGNTLNEEKYAYKIKKGLIDCNYNVCCVGKELSSLNDVPFVIDVLDLCIHPALGLKLLQENKKNIKIVVIQPGAESTSIKDYLKHKNIDYMEGCLLVGLRLYKNYEIDF